jgi:spore germination protein YaaH
MCSLRKLTGCLFVFMLLCVCVPCAYSQKIHLPEKVSAPKLPKDTAVKAKLIKKILNAFKFTKNARAREQERVITIINQILTDSLVVTAREIQLLNEQLSKTENQHFDSLVALINTMGINCRVPPPPEDTVPAQTDTAAAPPDNDLNALVNKMLPILQQKTDLAASEKAKQEKLNTVRAVYGRPGDQVDTLKLSDSLGARYTINLTQKVSVNGIHPYWMGDKYLNYNFSALTTFSFLGYTADGKTGQIKASFDTTTLKALQAAAGAGCNIQLIISDKSAANISSLLQHQEAQLAFADTLAHLLQQKQANGVTIYFEQVSGKQRQAFTDFIHILYGHLHNYNPGYTVNIVIPAFDKQMAYDLKALNASVTFFLVDFTHAGGNTAGALAPLKGDPARSIDATISRYLQRDVPPAKFVLLLPYYGAVWHKGQNGSPDAFSSYMSYQEIRTLYPSDTLTLYDETAESAFIEVKNDAGAVQEEIWFDDASTLGPKYDYVLNNNLGGVALWTLGADNGYGDLWDELVDKFVVPDTVFLDTIRLTPPPPVQLTFWERIKKELHAYRQMFRDPCSVESTDYIGDTYFSYAAIFLFTLVIALTVFYITGVRNNGDDWKLKKKTIVALIALLNLFIITAAMAIFLSKDLPWLGITDDPAQCHSIPLNTLLIILAIGFMVGIVATRFLLLPLLKRDEVP